MVSKSSAGCEISPRAAAALTARAVAPTEENNTMHYAIAVSYQAWLLRRRLYTFSSTD